MNYFDCTTKRDDIRNYESDNRSKLMMLLIVTGRIQRKPTGYV